MPNIVNSKIYLLKAGEFYKIGITKNTIESRIKQLQTGNPHVIEIAYKVEDMAEEHVQYYENALHQFFKDLRLTGEWFKLTDKDVISTIAIMDFIKLAPSFTKSHNPKIDIDKINEKMKELDYYQEKTHILEYEKMCLEREIKDAREILEYVQPDWIYRLKDKILDWGTFRTLYTNDLLNADDVLDAYVEAYQEREYRELLKT